MDGDAKVQEYLALSGRYLRAAETLIGEENLEPAIFDALHAMELAIKAALYTVSDEDIDTHRVAGLFGRHFREIAGVDFCRDITKSLEKYNLARYPGMDTADKDEAKRILAVAVRLIRNVVPDIISKQRAAQ
jgi:HEPN domain-containing protein